MKWMGGGTKRRCDRALGAPGGELEVGVGEALGLDLLLLLRLPGRLLVRVRLDDVLNSGDVPIRL
jgi:hypothetical protein